MATIKVFDGGSEPFRRPADTYPPEAVERLPAAELDGTRVRYHHPGGSEALQLFELEMAPGLALAPHAHEADEIIAVLSGQLLLGSRVLEPGSSLFVPGNTLYTVKAGPEGCRFLNFRAAADTTYLTRDDMSRRRREAAESP